MTPSQIEWEGEGRRRGEARVAEETGRACKAAGVVVHWTEGGFAGERPACGQRGRCFTWPEGEDLFESGFGGATVCRKCKVIWGNQEA